MEPLLVLLNLLTSYYLTSNHEICFRWESTFWMMGNLLAPDAIYQLLQTNSSQLLKMTGEVGHY